MFYLMTSLFVIRKCCYEIMNIEIPFVKIKVLDTLTFIAMWKILKRKFKSVSMIA